jgi:hypothetical protein
VDDTLHRKYWKTGLITKTNKSADKIVRTDEILMPNKRKKTRARNRLVFILDEGAVLKTRPFKKNFKNKTW